MKILSEAFRSGRDFGANLAIVLLLSFGLGTATLLFTALDRLLLHPLNIPQPRTLVRAAIKRPSVISRTGFSFDTYREMQQMKSFRDAAAEAAFDTTLITGGTSQRVFADMVSGAYFRVLGVAPQIGRPLEPADEQPSSGGVPVVLSYRFWKRQLGGSPSILGTSISLQGQWFTIVGVMPGDFVGTAIDSSPDLWLPFAAQPLLSQKSLSDPNSDRFFSMIGRLKDRVPITQAEAEFESFYRARTTMEGAVNPGQAILQPIGEHTFVQYDQFAYALSLLLWGLAAFLVIMCANIAGLLLARAARRERDSAVRLALGASRTRLIRQDMFGSIRLGFAGAVGGLVVAYFCGPLLRRMLPSGLRFVSLRPNFENSAMVVVLALLISVIFGFIPAWISSRTAPEQTLRRGTATKRSGILSRTLLVLQTGLTIALLVESGLLIHSYYALRETNVGFDAEHLVAFSLNSQIAGPGGRFSPTLPLDLEQRVQSLPGVGNASLSSGAVMHRIGTKTSVAVAGQKIAKQSFLNTTMNDVSSSYFDTLRIPIIAGRVFTAADQQRMISPSAPSAPVPVVINQAFARQIFPNENPLGKLFGHGAPGQLASPKYTVVGIAADSKFRSLREDMLPIFYAPLIQRVDPDEPFFFMLYVRSAASPTSIIGTVRNALAAVNPRLPFFEVATMHELMTESLWQERLLAALSLIFAFVSIFMAVTGLYGLLSYEASRRMREFGIRVAVGARKIDLAVLLLKDVAKIVSGGAVLGIASCLLFAHIMASALYGVRPMDPISFVGALVIVGLIVLAASWQPVLQAMNVEVATVLKDE